MLFRTFRSVVDHIGNHHFWNSAWCRLDVHRCIVVLLFLVLLLLSSTITFFHAWKIYFFLWRDSIVIWYLFNFFFVFGNVKRLSIRPTFYLPLPKIILVLSSSSYRFLRIKCVLTKKRVMWWRCHLFKAKKSEDNLFATNSQVKDFLDFSFEICKTSFPTKPFIQLKTS